MLEAGGMQGETLAHYKVGRLLGKGGMGEVYEADDLKLGRKVALKVLREEVTSDTERRTRFERGTLSLTRGPGLLCRWFVVLSSQGAALG